MPLHSDALELSGPDATTPLRASVCIVGSGFAGAILAVELARAGVDVLVLEAGDARPDPDRDGSIDKVAVPAPTQVRLGFSRELGGTSSRWTGRLAPLEDVDFEAREWVPASGWPLARKALEPCYQRASEILGVPPFGTRGGIERPDFVSGDRLELKVFHMAGTPFNAARYLEDAARQYRNLRVVLNAPVTELREPDNHRLVDAAMVALPNGRIARIEAARFVIAAGGIESPRLLLSSSGTRPDGIGNDHGMVGRFLSTHPKENLATLILDRPIETAHPLFGEVMGAQGTIHCGLGFRAEAQREFRLLNHYVQVLPFPDYRANRLSEMLRGSRSFDSPLVDREALIAGYGAGAVSMAQRMLGRATGRALRARKFVLRGFLDQHPNPENRVTLSQRTDAHGMPRANVKWAYSADDRASVVAFFERLAAEFRERGVERLSFEKLRQDGEWPLIGIHSHFMGTTRMGSDPSTSVTDANARVHGSDNLFIAGPSLFPTYGYANPVHTIAALSLRLADQLKARD